MCNDCGPNKKQNLKFVHNFLDENANQFFHDYFQPSSTQYQVVDHNMIAGFNNVTCLNRWRSYLKELKLPAVMQKKDFHVTDGLEQIRNTIKRYALQGPTSYRTGEAKIEYL